MTKRERVLAMIVVSLAPLSLLLVLFMWVNSSLSQKDNMRKALLAQIDSAKLKQFEATLAKDRQQVYRLDSLPSNINLAKTQYHHWLVELAEKEIGLQGVDLTKLQDSIHRNEKLAEIFTQIKYKLAATGTLEQLTRLLYEFRRTRVLHRIASITINPINLQDSDGRRSAERTEELRITLVIEALSLKNADERRDFAGDRRDQLHRPLDDFIAQIARRDILGPANLPPAFARIGTQEVEEHEPISFPIQATDQDRFDKLEFNLAPNSIPDAKIRITGDNQVQFECPALEPGRYEFEITVTDNGWPAKSDTERFQVVVNEAVVENEPPEPKFKHASETVITAVTQNRKGQQQVWVNVKTTGDLFIVGQGESFDLDDATWSVFSVHGRLVQLDCNGRRMTFRVGDRLSQPMETQTIAETPPKVIDDSTIN